MASLTVLFMYLAIRSVYSVIPDYCYKPLNTSDCGREPIPVFYYYKPRSQCEIGYWRGCPTKNIFTNEFKCSHMCIGKLDKDYRDDYKPNVRILDKIPSECYITPISRVCTNEKTERYTYNKHSSQCELITWYGCPSKNIHLNREECETKCLRQSGVLEDSNDPVNDNDVKRLNNIIQETIDNVECVLLGECNLEDHSKEGTDLTNNKTKENGDPEYYSYYTDSDITGEDTDSNLPSDNQKTQDQEEISTKTSNVINTDSTDHQSYTDSNKDDSKVSESQNNPVSSGYERTTNMKVSTTITDKLPPNSTSSSVTEKADSSASSNSSPSSSPSSITDTSNFSPTSTTFKTDTSASVMTAKTDLPSSRVTKISTTSTTTVAVKTRRTGRPDDFLVQTPDPASDEYPFNN